MKTADAIKHFGTATRLAEELGISGAAVSMWGEEVPLGRAYQLQVLTKGALQVVQVKPKNNAAPKLKRQGMFTSPTCSIHPAVK